MLMLVAAFASTFSCFSPAIHDGDNLKCDGQNVRLAAIDAPDFEASPKCKRRQSKAICDDQLADRSRTYLQNLTTRQHVKCRLVDASPDTPGFQLHDMYHRPVARCKVGRTDLSDAMLKSGNARIWP